ncbi:hypothetical protein, partial [Mycobacterium tuberculosis]|uniref:hypothetical protein n=1 Tax=Mycobacterium tuberculosis TaxID=1773 RepID=UPI00207A5132
MALKLILVSIKGTIVNPHNVFEHQIAKELAALAKELHGHGVRVALWSNQAWTCDGQSLPKYIESLA